MTRRLLRYAADGLCLLSLLAAAATAWLWWRTRGGPPDLVQVAAGPVLVTVASHVNGVDLLLFRDWNSPPGVWVRLNTTPRRPEDRGFCFFYSLEDPPRREWAWGWWRGYTDTIRAHVGPDGRVARLTRSEERQRFLRGAAGETRPFPEWGIDVVPHWHLLLATPAAPAAWAALRGRRAWRRGRRARAGRCGACGYDLRATPDPAGPRLPR